MMNTNMIANKIDKGTEISIMGQVRDNDATFCYAAYAPKAEYISCYIFFSVGMHTTPRTCHKNKITW